MSNLYTTQPQIFPTRYTCIYWEGGISTDEAANASQGNLGILYGSALSSLLNKPAGTTLDITNLLGWPMTMPYNTARPIAMSNPNAVDWADLSINIVYRNIRGQWMTSTNTVLPGSTDAFLNIEEWAPQTPLSDVLDINLRRPQYVYKAFITVVNTISSLPNGRLNFDLGDGGATPLFQLQDSQRYWGTSIEIAQPVGADSSTINPYNIYINNIPQTALSNISLVQHPLWEAFYGTTPTNPLTTTSDLTQAQQILFSKGLPLFNANQNVYNLITPSMIGGNMWISFTTLSANNVAADQFITLLQNAVAH